MPGRSGSSVASHTMLAEVGDAMYALTAAQYRILKAAIAAKQQGVWLNAREVKVAKRLVARGYGKLNEENWSFVANPGVSVRP